MKFIILIFITIVLNSCKTSTSLGDPPEVPTQLKINYAGSDYISFSWLDNSDGEISGFKIYRSAGDVSNFTEIAIIEEDIISYIDSSIVSEQVYYYKVKSFNSSGESSASNLVCALSIAPNASLTPGSSLINVSESTKVTLNINNCYTPVFGISFRLHYNSAILSFSDSSDLSLGSFFGQEVISFVRNEDSFIYGAISLINDQLPVNGSADVCTLEFTGMSAGECNLDIVESDFFFYDSLGNKIDYANLKLNSAQVVVQ